MLGITGHLDIFAGQVILKGKWNLNHPQCLQSQHFGNRSLAWDLEAWQVQSHLARWDEKVHAVVARSTFRSQNVQNTPGPDHFWKLRCRKSARRCGAKHISKSKCTKHHMLAPLLEVQMSFRVAGARDCAPCQKWAKREGFVAFPKTMAGVGHLKRICKDAFRVAGAVQKTCSSRDVRRSGRWFPERGCILEHPICRFAEMILRDRCSTSYDLASIFRGRRSTLDRWSGKIAKRIGTRLSALHLTFYFWRKSRRIALFLMLSCSKIEERLAELLRFGCCQVQKLQKSRRIVSFLTLSSSKLRKSRRIA